jgi:trimeric autotransporter adhesin
MSKFVLQPEDGSVDFGNTRGDESVDLQVVRNNATEVASGYASFLIGGKANTASGTYSAAFGANNTASGIGSLAIGQGNGAVGNYSLVGGLNSQSVGLSSASLGYECFAYGPFSAIAFSSQSTTDIGATYGYVAGGDSGNAYLYGQNVISNGRFSAQGDAQTAVLIARKSAVMVSASTTILSLDGTGTTNLIIPKGNNRSWGVTVSWTAVVTAITGTATGVTIGDTKVSTDLLALAKRSGVTSVSAHTSLGTRVIDTIGGSLTAVNITYSAGASQELQITFTGPTFSGGGSVTMRVVAKVELTEVAY